MSDVLTREGTTGVATATELRQRWVERLTSLQGQAHEAGRRATAEARAEEGLLAALVADGDLWTTLWRLAERVDVVRLALLDGPLPEGVEHGDVYRAELCRIANRLHKEAAALARASEE